MTLTEFLLARIAEDQRIAEEAADGHSRAWHVQGGRIENGDDEIVVYDEGSPDEYEIVHIARWDPARVLAECNTKRRIVKQANLLRGEVSGPESDYTLRALALSYSEHPDYRQDWAV